jgi:hypothetical protein
VTCEIKIRKRVILPSNVEKLNCDNKLTVPSESKASSQIWVGLGNVALLVEVGLAWVEE